MNNKIVFGFAAVLIYSCYQAFFSAKVDLYFNVKNIGEFQKVSDYSLDEIIQNHSVLEERVDRFCTSRNSKSANIIMLEELTVLEGNALLSGVLKKSPPITNSDNYSREFIIYHRLARVFPNSVSQLNNDLVKSPDSKKLEKDGVKFKELGKDVVKLKTIPSAFEVPNGDAQFLNDFLALIQCSSAKMSLGLIGRDEDFSRNVKLLESELLIKNAEAADRALEEIRKSLN